VFLGAGGVVTNSAGARIRGSSYGIYIAGGAGTVINAGTVSGTSSAGVGVFLGLGGVVSNNGTGALISGQLFSVIAVNSPATVINPGQSLEWRG
jgi:hypothetical protein